MNFEKAKKKWQKGFAAPKFSIPGKNSIKTIFNPKNQMQKVKQQPKDKKRSKNRVLAAGRTQIQQATSFYRTGSLQTRVQVPEQDPSVYKRYSTKGSKRVNLN